MNDYVITQANDVRPPRIGNIIVLGVDATSRAYDLTALLFNGVPSNLKSFEDYFYLSIMAETNDVFWALDKVNTDTILDTTATSAGGTPALDSVAGSQSNTQCARLISGLPPVDFYLDRAIDKHLILKCAAGKTATIRLWASSRSTPGVL